VVIFSAAEDKILGITLQNNFGNNRRELPERIIGRGHLQTDFGAFNVIMTLREGGFSS